MHPFAEPVVVQLQLSESCHGKEKKVTKEWSNRLLSSRHVLLTPLHIAFARTSSSGVVSAPAEHSTTFVKPKKNQEE
jgi:hypothetical protein